MARVLGVFATYVLIVGMAFGIGRALAEEHGAKDQNTGAMSGEEMSADEKAMMEAWAASMISGPQHAKLASLAGTWTVRSIYWMAPDAEPEAGEGTAERTMIFDGRVLREEFTGDYQGQPYFGIGHTGYDNVTGEYWSTWMDNMMTGLAVLKGQWDEEKQMMIYEGEVPDPMAGGLTTLRIESRMEGEDTEIDDFFEPGPDGEMYRMMELVYERQ